MPPLPTLQLRRHPLDDPAVQRERLADWGGIASFESMLESRGPGPLRASEIAVLQLNLGKVCNQTCHHCHVDAGPDRRERMDRETMRACLEAVKTLGIPKVDLTGGAPEMNPEFRWLVGEARALGAHVIDRCNLTILLAAGYRDLPEFLAGHEVEVVASLPCYLEKNTDAQRGDGVFGRSIEALRRLNDVGYGREGSGLDLTLVYNPVGRSLPPDQARLEATYRRELAERYGIEFTRLYTITNMPISRYLEELVREGALEEYMERLVEGFNPATVAGLMCRTTLSVGWDGRLFDCDFNQMLDLPLGEGVARTVRDVDWSALAGRAIRVGPHCFGCTAGAGSSCQGSVVRVEGEASALGELP